MNNLSIGANDFEVAIDCARESLLAQEDTDDDGKITVDDSGPKVCGTYTLANLLQELVLKQDSGGKTAIIQGPKLVEDPVSRIDRRIKSMFWYNLLRRLDSSMIRVAARDPKDWSEDFPLRIYIPWNRADQYEYYSQAVERAPDLKLEVCYLPRKKDITPEFVKDLNSRPGVLALQMKKHEDLLRGCDFVVPGGRFNELYGWDTYFCALGLFEAGWTQVVKDIVLNFCFEIDNYGCVLNANRTYYLGRSQPPFLTDLILRTYSRIKHQTGSKEFLRITILAAIKEYHHVWMSQPRLDPITGLSRYRSAGLGICPEVEEAGYDHIIPSRAEKYGMTKDEFKKAYNDGTIQDKFLDDYFMHDRAVRESGHDTSWVHRLGVTKPSEWLTCFFRYRLESVAADMATVDLNSLLYKYETDIAWVIKEVFDDSLEVPEATGAIAGQPESFQTSSEWLGRARQRKECINKYLWNGQEGMFFDYNTAKGEQSIFETVTCLWPLWSGVADNEQAASLVAKALPKFEQPGGLVSTTKQSAAPPGPNTPKRQWDYPHGWAPHQMLAWDGLQRYGYCAEAERIAYRWLHMITKTAVDFNGMITEKYNVTQPLGQHKTDAEYGNQGCNFHGLAREGFGWTNASYSYGLTMISDKLKKALTLGLSSEAAAGVR
ncbi:MAG: alpha,alpha-trehalase nth1 [Alyxoria varia]|nr:MAG: alpha,alpha-trehalase nth1 [Alyxoria varia]